MEELERLGVEVRTWKLDPVSLQLELGELDALMGERTRLVAWTHASNVLGRIHPVREIADFVRARGAMSFVDGVALAPHRALDVQAFGVDFYVVSLYKVFGPHMAMLFGRRGHLRRLPAVNHYFIGDDALPYKFQPGNANFELTASLTGLWDYIEFVGASLGLEAAGPADRKLLERVFAEFGQREAELAERLLGFLRDRDGVRILGPEGPDPDERVSTISFVVEGRQSREIVRAADAARIGIRFGDFYARRLIETLGLTEQGGVVRVSMLHYNTEAEVDRLLEVLDSTI